MKVDTIAVLLLAVLLSTAKSASSSNVDIEQVMTSYAGDPTAQFVQLKLNHSAILNLTQVGAFDAAGNFLGNVATLSVGSPVPSGTRWLVGTPALQTASGLSVDTLFNGPVLLPETGGMVCWGTPSIPTNASMYDDCLAYGTYSGPPNYLTAGSTTLAPAGHSLRRLLSKGSSFHDFKCADPADPTNSSGSSAPLAATTPCPVCGDNTRDAGEVCDGTDDASCPGTCDIDCTCADDADADGRPDAVDACTTWAWSGPHNPPNQNPHRAKVAIRNIDDPGGSTLKATGSFLPERSEPPPSPDLSGASVRIEDSGGVLYDVSLPGGPGCQPSDYWTYHEGHPASNVGAYYKYVNHSGAVPPGCLAGSAQGIRSVIIRLVADPYLRVRYKYALRARDVTLLQNPAQPVTDLRFDLTLGAQPSPGVASAAAQEGDCAEARFQGAPVANGPPPPFCRPSPQVGPLRHLTCRGQ